MSAPHHPPRRYLDNAATTWPKPPEVFAAWDHAAREVGAAAGRAAYRDAAVADGIRAAARAGVARLLGDVDPARVALPSGCTLALNMAIHGLVRPGMHVVATAADHNASLRPLHALAQRGLISLDIVPCDGLGRVDPADVAAAWRPATGLVVCTHASNVTGGVLDIPAIAALVHERGGLVVLDAAQSLGHIPLDAAALGADVIAAAAHKWLLGLGGTGLLWARPGLVLETFVAGGTGTSSEWLDMPAGFTDRHEPGTPDVPALAALAAAVAWLERRSLATTAAACRELANACAERLRTVPGVRVLAADAGPPIVSFTVAGYDPADVATILDQEAGVQVRSGFHCAACVHGPLGTQAGGTVRASFGPFNTLADVDALVGTVEALAG